MARYSDNPVIGRWECPAGGDMAAVFQTKRRGRHFYTKCTCCGTNQGQEAKRQQRIWEEAQWLPDAVVVRPSNVKDNGQALAGQVEQSRQNQERDQRQAPDQERDQVPAEQGAARQWTLKDADSDPAADPADDPAEGPEAGSSKGALIAGAVLVAAAIGGAMWS